MAPAKTVTNLSLLAVGILAVHGTAFASFPDVPASHANYDAISYIHAQGMVSGYSDEKFHPDATITRAEFVKILVNADSTRQAELDTCVALHTDPEQAYVYYYDVIDNDWFAGFVCIASEQGLISGYPSKVLSPDGDPVFGPNRPVNFAEASKVIVKLTNPDFHGTATQSPWYAPFITELGQKHAIPTSIHSFDQLITRGEMAEMIYRLKAGITNKPSKTYDDLAAVSTNAKSQGSMMVTVYLVKDNENGACPGGSSGCYDLYVPVQISVPKTTAALRASLKALLNLQTTSNGCYGDNCSLHSALYLSHLQVLSATIVKGVAHVKLTGEAALAGDADGSRAVEQITRTVKQFPSVTSANITLNGNPLRCLADLSGKCENASTSGMTTVKLYFGEKKVMEASDCAATKPVTRQIPKTPAVADATLRLLLQGVTPEDKAQGLISDFENKSGYYGKGIGSLLSYYQGISVVNGMATVKFSGDAMAYLNNTACTQEELKSSIGAILLQFPSIKSIQYSIDGKVVTGWDL